ncbi:ADP-ribosyltransferase domain-containing protein [Mesorhizobium opportunistum]|uniref:NAD(+)--protein-arginine ADP-ribosyltransferase n=1 Tax=Mesorhizobium opportunistum TaxID=593909 RepID=A0ABV1YGD3_9HYPH|nr:ADP-ribosyltransferase domain-containing protein [Mesorhizobium sp.]TIN97077.1 MAG: hypothetical protein E5Y06_05720 [Mesorhizobium sp.]TJV00024.1 MAG: hypothetical protein E5Y08_06170 [Mesorhizobium sp.]TJV16946.1 MAG: hypothetical protein E5Y07_14845 [Mesorhizobium sp.]
MRYSSGELRSAVESVVEDAGRDSIGVQGEWISLFGESLGYDLFHEFLESTEECNIRAAGQAMGLNLQESLAVHAYSMGFRDGTGCFTELNRRLRNRIPKGKFYGSLFTDLKDAVAKLPTFDGIVYRRTEIPESMLHLLSLRPTAGYRDPAFLSASTSTNAFAGRDMLVIQSIQGCDISALSAFPEEQEVLFMPNTSFQISKVLLGPVGTYLELIDLR